MSHIELRLPRPSQSEHFVPAEKGIEIMETKTEIIKGCKGTLYYPTGLEKLSSSLVLMNYFLLFIYHLTDHYISI